MFICSFQQCRQHQILLFRFDAIAVVDCFAVTTEWEGGTSAQNTEPHFNKLKITVPLIPIQIQAHVAVAVLKCRLNLI